MAVQSPQRDRTEPDEPRPLAEPGPCDLVGGPGPGPGRSLIGFGALLVLALILGFTFTSIYLQGGIIMIALVVIVLIAGIALIWGRPLHPGPYAEHGRRGGRGSQTGWTGRHA